MSKEFADKDFNILADIDLVCPLHDTTSHSAPIESNYRCYLSMKMMKN